MEKILVIDDSIPFLTDTEVLLAKYFDVCKASCGRKGLSILQKEKISAVLLDLKLPDINGLDVLKKIKKEIDPHLPVIIVTDYGDIPTTVEAMLLGAEDFIQKDFNRELLSKKIKTALEKNKLELENKLLKNGQDEQYDKFIFSSNIMQNIDLEITRHAMHSEHVLLCGETGTGKDLIAHKIHKRSSRQNELFLTVPINSLNETLLESELFGHEKGAFTGAENPKIGLFEAANKGSIYIPEISEINERIQIKLLDFMQHKIISRVGSSGKKIKLDVRVIMATNKDLKSLVEQNKFRCDFYYRISPFTINIPPLRKRIKDIRYLAPYFLKKFSKHFNKKGLIISEDLLRNLECLDWKGNIRELSSSIMHAVLYAEDNTILTNELFPCFMETEYNGDGKDLPETYKAAEKNFRKEFFQKLLHQTDGNKTKAAELAGISRQGLSKILKELNIE